MSFAYISGINEHFPHTEITFDRFHLMKIINSAVDEVRYSGGTRYLWLKNRSNLTKAQKDTLKEIESMPGLNIKTIKAFHIRENFQSLYKESTVCNFERMLKRWYFWATHSRIEPIIDAAKTIKRHWHGVISWVRNRKDNGIPEGLSSLIQAALGKGKGIQDIQKLQYNCLPFDW